MVRSHVLLAVTQASTDSAFSFGTLLMFVGGAILLAFFCSIGVIARLRENRLEERKLAEQATSQRIKSDAGGSTDSGVPATPSP